MKTQTANVLLVEDDFALASSTMELLVALGYRARLADSASKAYESLNRPNDLDIVLLDLQLGRERGEAVVIRLRAAGRAIPPIIIMSAMPIKSLTDAVEITHAHGMLQKPCSMPQLVNAIESALA
jgi:DNA-binding response OmpR family regulator